MERPGATFGLLPVPLKLRPQFTCLAAKNTNSRFQSAMNNTIKRPKVQGARLRVTPLLKCCRVLAILATVAKGNAKLASVRARLLCCGREEVVDSAQCRAQTGAAADRRNGEGHVRRLAAAAEGVAEAPGREAPAR